MTRITITDVYLRDGLQDEDVFVATAEKRRIAQLLDSAGVPAIEATSFVSPARVPQLADADEVIAGLTAPGGSVKAAVSALALNDRGVDRAVAAGTQIIAIAASASEAHSANNAGRTTEQALSGLATVVSKCPQARFIAGVSTAFTCPFEGEVPIDRLVQIVRRLSDMGVESVGLADTLGTTPTARVLSALYAVRSALPDTEISLHLHNAHGQAIATALASVEAGVTRFDAALAGFGGCPFAPGAHGNVATEQLVAALHEAGHETGIDEEQLAVAADAAREAVRAGVPFEPSSA